MSELFIWMDSSATIAVAETEKITSSPSFFVKEAKIIQLGDDYYHFIDGENPKFVGEYYWHHEYYRKALKIARQFSKKITHKIVYYKDDPKKPPMLMLDCGRFCVLVAPTVT